MTRCLLILHSFGGGAEFVALNLAQHLDRRRFTPSIACTRHLPELAQRLPSGVDLIMPADSSFGAWLCAMRDIRRAAGCSQVVLGTLELQSIAWAALFAKGKAVAWLHKDLGGYFARKKAWYVALYSTITRWAFARCRTVACVSQGVLESARSVAPAAGPHLRLLYNPVDFAAIRMKANEPLAETLESCFGKPVILGVGRLVEQKAFHLLVQAHALLRGQGNDCHLCILGEGPERARLQQEAERLDVAASVFMPGFINPYPAMRRAAVLGVSSIFEGSPLVILEALHLGLPVASTDCPHGPAETLAGGEYGALVPMNDPVALAAALARRMDPARREEYARAGWARVEDFSLEKAMAAWEEALLEAASVFHP